MITPARVILDHIFYPIGNTPAVNFLRDTRFEDQQTVNILSLACGDPRNILFTIFSERESRRFSQRQQVIGVSNQAGASIDANTTFDFTTCDIEPAILARNIILLTLIEKFLHAADQHAVDQHTVDQTEGECPKRSIWNIFYHMCLPRQDLTIIHEHVKELLHASSTPEGWLSSTYGAHIRFLNETTLNSVRDCWSQYAAFEDLTSPESIALEQDARAAISANLGKILRYPQRNVAFAIRSAGTRSSNALETLSDAFKAYWKTGVVGGNEADTKLLGNRGKGWLNPLFLVSLAPRRNFAVHWASDPLNSFYLAEAFDRQEPSLEDVVKTAKWQFDSWCYTLVKTLREGRIKITLHCGDAVSFCHGINRDGMQKSASLGAPPLRIAPWKLKQLTIADTGAYSIQASFDVIDSSNLADTVGLLNILPAVTPLLRSKSSSVLYTENLRIAAEGMSHALNDMLCSDVTTMSLLVGLCPIAHLVTITTDSFDIGIWRQLSRCCRMRIPWKMPKFMDMGNVGRSVAHSQPLRKLTFDAVELGDYLLAVYLKMFSNEREDQMMLSPNTMPGMGMMLRPVLAQPSLYNRFSFAALIGLAQASISTDWAQCLDYFFDKVRANRSLKIGPNSLQELELSLDLYGISEEPALNMSQLSLAVGDISATSRCLLRVLFQESMPPSVVHVVLVVPRKALHILTEHSPNEIGNPGLHLTISDYIESSTYSFFAIQCFFGRLQADQDAINVCNVEEDTVGWAGSADLIVTCAVPAYIFLRGEAKDIRVALVVNPSPSTLHHFARLGAFPVMFECGLQNNDRLRLFRKAPGLMKDLHEQIRGSSITSTEATGDSCETYSVSVHLDSTRKARTFRFHVDAAEKSQDDHNLASKADIVVRQCSPCTMLFQFGPTEPQALVFPLPVDGSNPITKVGKDSRWFEVIVPLDSAPGKGGFRHNLFPLVFNEDHPSVWAMSRVNIDQQPTINMLGGFDWLAHELELTLSAKERTVDPPDTSNGSSNDLHELKSSIMTIFHGLVGYLPGGTSSTVKVCRLVLDGRCDTLIFLNAVRHDRNTGSVMIDAHVVCQSHSRMQTMVSALPGVCHKDFLSITVSEEESVLWKRLLPCFAERCRNSWTHGKNCAYVAQCRIPLSVSQDESPLCSCGEGKDLDSSLAEGQYKDLAKLATRIAIAPLFAVPYVEQLLSGGPAGNSNMQNISAPDQGPLRARDTSTSIPAAARCDHCGKARSNLKPCKRCGVTRYCNHDCSKAAWKNHKKTCNK
ncbi:MAG: hypothetical protein Q9201_000413 [Fulgogasparrea decipioides]